VFDKWFSVENKVNKSGIFIPGLDGFIGLG